MPIPSGIPFPRFGLPGQPGTAADGPDYGAAQDAQSNRAIYGQFSPLYTGLPAGSFGTPTDTPGITRSPGQTFNIQQILAGQAPGVGAAVVGGSPGTDAEYASMGLPVPTQSQTNLGAYTFTPDQFASPQSTPSLDYLGLPNYSSDQSNSDNGFAALFGAGGQQGFMTNWG